MDEDFGKKVWQINRSSKRLIIVTHNWDDFSLAVADNSPNPPNFPLPNIQAIIYYDMSNY